MQSYSIFIKFFYTFLCYKGFLHLSLLFEDVYTRLYSYFFYFMNSVFVQAMAEEKAPSRWQQRKAQKAAGYANSNEGAAILHVRQKRGGRYFAMFVGFCISKVNMTTSD